MVENKLEYLLPSVKKKSFLVTFLALNGFDNVLCREKLTNPVRLTGNSL